jgi:hypothetical protein
MIKVASNSIDYEVALAISFSMHKQHHPTIHRQAKSWLSFAALFN